MLSVDAKAAECGLLMVTPSTSTRKKAFISVRSADAAIRRIVTNEPTPPWPRESFYWSGSVNEQQLYRLIAVCRRSDLAYEMNPLQGQWLAQVFNDEGQASCEHRLLDLRVFLTSGWKTFILPASGDVNEQLEKIKKEWFQ